MGAITPLQIHRRKMDISYQILKLFDSFFVPSYCCVDLQDSPKYFPKQAFLLKQPEGCSTTAFYFWLNNQSTTAAMPITPNAFFCSCSIFWVKNSWCFLLYSAVTSSRACNKPASGSEKTGKYFKLLMNPGSFNPSDSTSGRIGFFSALALPISCETQSEFFALSLQSTMNRSQSWIAAEILGPNSSLGRTECSATNTETEVLASCRWSISTCSKSCVE